ncbi:dead box ATP-dependent rna helicase [Viridothelium virens]|uniref:RNA helicase n=1 Tax=Viridothelium virens TaxID=1048519 RepID=A0A6A6HDZ4_VIRVR|nr:dead box ATP-dependent rna helicase [Viridothelium virens]
MVNGGSGNGNDEDDESQEDDSRSGDEDNSEGGDDENEEEEDQEEDEDKVKARNRTTTNEAPLSAAAAKILGSVYVEHPSLAETPQEKIDEYLAQHFITINDPSSHPKYRPATKFAHLPFNDGAHRTIYSQFKDPTPIQAAAWPYAMAGRDVIGIAETGSGKTLAFGSPCIRHITSIPKGGKRKGIRAVVITPTRELACQIFEYMKKLGSGYRLGVVCLYGGVSKEQQREDLITANIVVATPGRLQDLIDEGAADMSMVSYLVLDEADRMLEKGFDEAIKKIVRTMPKNGADRQTLMFTATWPASIRELAATYMTEPVRIGIGDNPDGELRANKRITQTVEVVLPSQKQLRLLQILKRNMRGEGQDRILVFCLYKKEAFKVEVFLKRKDLRVVSIHGDLNQSQRTANLQAFKDGYVPILVATDVASRGLDIPNVNLVVNMTFPLTVEDYVHRIGRTGRAGKTGLAITLFSQKDKHLAGELIGVLEKADQKVPNELLKFGRTVKKKQHEAYGNFYKDPTEMKKPTKITFDD